MKNKILRFAEGAVLAAIGAAGLFLFAKESVTAAVSAAAADNSLGTVFGTLPDLFAAAGALILVLGGIAVLLSSFLPRFHAGRICWELIAVFSIAAVFVFSGVSIVNVRSAGSSDASASAAPAETAAPAEEDGPFASFTAQTFDGGTMDGSVLAGKKVTVLNCWATYCGPCVAEMPVLSNLNEEYAEKGLQVIGLCGDTIDEDTLEVDDDALETAQAIIEKSGVTYPQLIPSADMKKGQLADIQSYPATFFLDEHGNVLKFKQGGTDEKTWRALFDEVLSGL